MKRKEEDSLGVIEIDDDKFYGSITQRSKNLMSIGNIMPIDIIHSFAIIKKASAIANYKLNLLSEEKKDLIVEIANEILDKKYDDHFPLRIFQTGSGTHTNMNVNEVIANIASIKTKNILGSKIPLHPNDDVNLSQSSNDTFPSAMHISSYFLIKNKLLVSLKNLIKGFLIKEKEFENIIKIARTHLMDAVPIKLSQELSSYRSQIENITNDIDFFLEKLKYLPLGATAVGTGINSHKNFSKLVIDEISNITKENFKVSKNFFSSISSNDEIVQVSACLKTLSTIFMKLSNDLSFLASGPRAGLNELILPKNEPGSSIMPGKINPTQLEALRMVSIKVMSNDLAITLCNSTSHFQLNTNRPLMIYSLLDSINLLSEMMDSFLNNLLLKIIPNIKQIEKNLNNSLMLSTALSKKIGYDKTAKIVNLANSEEISLKEASIKLNFIDEKTFDAIVDPKKMV
ncbi:MAG: Fumarate hydratase class II [Candidatus Anoxychlamydiales bacterium]|nr:Fumarate hydratase class II [Candidatus Anoxychlamydiales bacterium]